MIFPIAYISAPAFQEHFPGSFHPERAQRLIAIESLLKQTSLWDNFKHFQPTPAAREDLLLAHHPDLIDFNLSQKGKKISLDADTHLSEKSIEVALLAAGAGLLALDLIFVQKKYSTVFAAVRPPGHHAEVNRSMGFCIFNNVAVAAAYAINKKFAEKVLIIDWDVHHGNGTQEIFFGRNDVFYMSMHQSPLYPGTGFSSEIGTGAGIGFTYNYPLVAGSDDKTYISSLNQSLEKIGAVFSPDIIFISAGFDAHKNDPIGGMIVSEEGFAEMTKLVMAFADKHCAGRIISMLEGGYDLDGLSSSVYHHLKTLLENNV